MEKDISIYETVEEYKNAKEKEKIGMAQDLQIKN